MLPFYIFMGLLERRLGLLRRTRKERLMAEVWVTGDAVTTPLRVVKASVSRWIEPQGLSARTIGRLRGQRSEVDRWVRAWGVVNPYASPPGEVDG